MESSISTLIIFYFFWLNNNFNLYLCRVMNSVTGYLPQRLALYKNETHATPMTWESMDYLHKRSSIRKAITQTLILNDKTIVPPFLVGKFQLAVSFGGLFPKGIYVERILSQCALFVLLTFSIKCSVLLNTPIETQPTTAATYCSSYLFLHRN